MQMYGISENVDNLKADHFENKKDQLIEIKDPLIINRIDANHVGEFSKFVYHVYLHDYTEKNHWIPDESSLRDMIKEDRNYFKYSAYIICSTEEAGILGTFKVTKKNRFITFPIETEFGIKLEDLTNFEGLKVDDVWHFGRLAIDKEKIKKYDLKISSVEILQRLLITSIRLLCDSADNLIVTEIDYKVFRLMLKMGFNMEMVGQPKFYLGSVTCPAVATARDLLNWLECHENQPEQLPQYNKKIG